MPVRWSRAALQELDDASEFIGIESPQRALALLQSVYANVDRLTQFPALGRLGRVDGTRELVISGTPYIVAYRLSGEVVEILHVIHAARQWPERF